MPVSSFFFKKMHPEGLDNGFHRLGLKIWRLSGQNSEQGDIFFDYSGGI